ncbi:FAD-binding protein [Parahaliea maris]|uniref:FAD-binding protein n=1 Tax=Parahaliea maris TaxID=2716870 RepID=A0A5C8ZU08_9GAMM|nr:FAD-dependent oxidoreductase [Parahaliea maris]TXS91975.1 FAD-binding protein [Parahaliea maris]
MAKLTKRQFLSVAGTTAAASLALRDGVAHAEPAGSWDLIVVGGGTAGIPAAIFAAQRGAKVLILEAAGALGGTLYLSSAQLSAAGTKLQEEKGIEDTPEEHFADIMKISKNTGNQDIIRLAVFNAAATFDWLMDSGLELLPDMPTIAYGHDPYSKPRYAWAPKMGIDVLNVMMGQLQPHIDSQQVEVMLQTRATALIQDESGSVTGVESVDADGVARQHIAQSVVLTSGGYSANDKLFEELEGNKRYCNCTYPMSQGHGLSLGVSAGGYIRGMEHHLPLFGAVLTSDDYPSGKLTTHRPWPPHNPPLGIFINTEGERFMAEDVPSHDAHEQALLGQTDERCWLVWDDEMLQNPEYALYFSRRFDREKLKEAFDNGTAFFDKADSLPELGQLAGFDGDKAVATLAEYNRGQSSGSDRFGRKHMPLPLAKAPFYAVRLQSWQLVTFAGIAVNDKLEVIRRDGQPVPGLYAAGEVIGAGATMGRSYCGGMQVTPAITFGRMLGQDIIPLKT